MKVYDFRVGIIIWRDDDQMASLLSEVLTDLGCSVVDVWHDSTIPSGLDVVLAFGPFGSLTHIADQLLFMDRNLRPLFVLWMSEQFPDPDLPGWILAPACKIRTGIDRLMEKNAVLTRQFGLTKIKALSTKGLRFRYYGDLLWLKQKGILSVLAVGSRWIADYLRVRGFDPVVAYYGLEKGPIWGERRDLEREIQVLWIGRMMSGRRIKFFEKIRYELRYRGIEMLVIDGKENPPVFDEARTALLNRVKININLLRKPWDNNSMRYYLSALNGALIVTEPTLEHVPFVNGVHLVEVSIEHMAETILYYLTNERARIKITNNAYNLVTQDLVISKGIIRIFDRVSSLLNSN